MGVTDVEEWIEIATKCQYLPENDLKVKGFQSLKVLCGSSN